MIPEYNKENRRLLDMFLNDTYFQRLVENDLGAPIKVVVWWEKGVVKFAGRHSGKILQISDILDGARAIEANRAEKALPN